MELRRHQLIIAAAVAAITEGRGKIRSIREAPARHPDTWIRTGRLSIHTSHQLTPPLARVLPRSYR